MGPLHPQGENVKCGECFYQSLSRGCTEVSHDQSCNQKAPYVIITAEYFIYSRSLIDRRVKCGLELLCNDVFFAGPHFQAIHVLPSKN